MKPLTFQDDLARMSTSVEAAQAGNNMVATVINKKQLEVNIDKSSFIILGNKKKVQEMRDTLHNKGSQESTNFTIKERHWRVISAILEIKSIVQDYKSSHIGGILTGVELWELAVLPMLLNNCGSWDVISPDSTKKLNDLQNTLLRYLLLTPRTTPIPALIWEFGMLPMESRILIKKLCLTKHIMSLDTKSLAKQIFQIQQECNFPGLAKEAKKNYS